MTNLVDTTEMYLRTILDLEEEGITPLRARISERLGHSGPTVSQTVARMERDGLVEVAGDRRLLLTGVGRDLAVRVLRKHRIAEGLLAQVLGLDLAQVHEEACRWEHVMSDEAERRIYDLLGRPDESPYGTPIPGLEDFGRAPAGAFLDGVESLAAAAERLRPGEVSGERVVRRLGEPVQQDAEAIALLMRTELLPGAEVTFELADDELIVGRAGAEDGVRLPAALAEHLYLAVDGR